jgi:hypothetical protein
MILSVFYVIILEFYLGNTLNVNSPSYHANAFYKYYVDTEHGSDIENNCTDEGNPCKTFDHSMNIMEEKIDADADCFLFIVKFYFIFLNSIFSFKWCL